MRCIAFLTRFALTLALAAPQLALGDEIEVQSAQVRPTEHGLVLDAQFALELTPRLVEAVNNGVPLYFRLDFILTRPRWYWFDEETASQHMQRRLSYHALSRQYRLSTGLLQQSFGTLEEALSVLMRVRNWLVVDRSVPLTGGDYEAAVRMRLDTSLLPKPFQLSALTSRDFALESPWYRFAIRSLRQAPAPVESREPLGEISR